MSSSVTLSGGSAGRSTRSRNKRSGKGVVSRAGQTVKSDADDGEGEFFVEKIVDKRVEKGKPYYYVKWYNWDSSTNTWEPLENLQNAIDLVEEFEKNQKRLLEAKAKLAQLVPYDRTSSASSSDDDERTPKDLVVPCTSSSVVQDSTTTTDDLAMEGAAGVGTECDPIDEETMKMDAVLFSPLFRRQWNQSEMPVSILGSTVEQGCLLHMVKVRKAGEPEPRRPPGRPGKLRQRELEHLKGVSENNVVIVLANPFNKWFPQFVIKQYEEKLEKLPVLKPKPPKKKTRMELEEEREKAEKRAALEQFKAEVVQMGRKKGLFIDPVKNFPAWWKDYCK